MINQVRETSSWVKSEIMNRFNKNTCLFRTFVFHLFSSSSLISSFVLFLFLWHSSFCFPFTRIKKNYYRKISVLAFKCLVITLYCNMNPLTDSLFWGVNNACAVFTRAEIIHRYLASCDFNSHFKAAEKLC